MNRGEREIEREDGAAMGAQEKSQANANSMQVSDFALELKCHLLVLIVSGSEYLISKCLIRLTVAE